MVLLLLAIAIIIIAGMSSRYLVFFSGLVLGAMVAITGIYVPLHGYEKPVLQEEYELVSINSDTNTYAILDSDGSVTCRYPNEELPSGQLYTYEKHAKVKIVEEGTKPVLKEYLVEPKTSIIAMAKCCTKTEYVIYVPESLLERWQNEHVN